MEEDDDDRQMVTHVLDSFAFHRFVEGFSPIASYNAVRAEIGQIVEPMMARAWTLGEIPGVEIGDEFVYREQIRLVGLHRDLIRGISTTLHGNGQEVAACVVANYADHNNLAGDDVYVYGGDGGKLIMAHRSNLGVLNHQLLENGNQAMVNSIAVGNTIHLLARLVMEDATRRYVFLGFFRVTGFGVVQSNNGFNVFEFFLERDEV
ncbi:hypothetical protein ACET3Z_026141 [Daucus carota]